jgi:phytoene desaturase
VQFRTKTPVQCIETNGRSATAVILANGERLPADVIVANADLPWVYSDLLPDVAQAGRLDRQQYTCSTIMFYWGVDRVYPQLGTHNVFLAGDYEGSFDRIFRDKSLPDEPSIYIHAPARVDPAAAPPGQDSLYALVPVGHLDEARGQEWPALQQQARTAVLRQLAGIGISDLESHLKFEFSYTPRDWQSRYNLARGAAFGLSHNFTQVGYLRPHNRHSRYQNLYFAGGSTHPGAGLPMVLLSARLTTERILKEMCLPQSAGRGIIHHLSRLGQRHHHDDTLTRRPAGAGLRG